MKILAKPVSTLLIIAVIFTAGLATSNVYAGGDHPDWPGSTPINVPSTTSGITEVQGDHDWFSFSAQGGTTYRAQVIPGSVSAGFVRTFRANGAGIDSSGSGDLTWTAPATETNFIEAWGSGTGTYQLVLTIVSDTTSPAISITSPTTGSSYTTNSSSLTLQGTASDNVSVSQVTWSNNRGGSGTASGTTSWTVNGISLQDGSNAITVTARDAAGNAASDSITVIYNPPDVTEPPAPSLISPPNASSTEDQTPTFDWSDVSDPSTPVTYFFQADRFFNWNNHRSTRPRLAVRPILLPAICLWVSTLGG